MNLYIYIHNNKSKNLIIKHLKKLNITIKNVKLFEVKEIGTIKGRIKKYIG